MTIKVTDRRGGALKEQLDALVVSLSAAKVGSRELDADIGRWLLVSAGDDGGAVTAQKVQDDWFFVKGATQTRVPLFTTFIDHALTLKPPSWVRDVDATSPDAGITVRLHDTTQERDAMGDHMSEAIATCLAALEAGRLELQLL